MRRTGVIEVVIDNEVIELKPTLLDQVSDSITLDVYARTEIAKIDTDSYYLERIEGDSSINGTNLRLYYTQKQFRLYGFGRQVFTTSVGKWFVLFLLTVIIVSIIVIFHHNGYSVFHFKNAHCHTTS